MLKKIAVVLIALVMAFGGILLGVYAGADDAPGGVLIALVVVVGAGTLAVLGVKCIDGRHRSS